MGKRWNSREDRILINCIEAALAENRTIREGFKDATEKLINRGMLACEQRFYTELKGKEKIKIDTGYVKPNAWTKEEDAILVQTVIEAKAMGKTDSEAFRIATSKMNNSRSSDAASYRWRSIRNNYSEQLEIAKSRFSVHQEVNKSKMQAAATSENTQINQSANKEKIQPQGDMLLLLEDMIKVYRSREVESDEVVSLRKQLDELQSKYDTLQSNYNSVMAIFEQGQRIVGVAKTH